MGVASRIRDIRPPLPAPTESMDEGEGTTSAYETDVATNVTTRTDKTSYEVPADGSPITIPTNRITSNGGGDIRVSKHDRQKSQTSLLIEYFEGSKTGDKTKSKPSVRVKVTPSSRKRTASRGHEAIQITGIGKDRKPPYTRRISLGGNSKNSEVLHVPPGTEGTEISHSSGSGNPLEIEVLESDMSTQSRGLMYAANESNVSSMPPDSMLEGGNIAESELSPARDYDDDITVKKEDYLEAPQGSRHRSTSQDRITQKVMEKLGQSSSKPYKSSRSRSERSLDKEYDRDGYPIEPRQRSSKGRHYDENTVGGAGSDLNPSQVSHRSGSDVSKASRVTNNPKLLEMVEDTVKRIILPEINAIKRDHSIRSSETSRRGSYDEYGGLGRRISKSSSSPNISSKPKVVLNREGDDPGTVLSRGDSERKQRKSSREHRPSSRRSSGSRRASYEYDDESTVREKSSKSSHKLRDAAAAGIAGGILTAGALKMHDRSQREDRYRDGDRERRRKRSSKSRGSGSRSASVAEGTEDAYTLRPKEDIPPMPMASGIHDSDLTRESILSMDTETPSAHTKTPVRQVSRGSLGTPTSRTPTRTSVGARNLGMSQSNQSIESPRSPGGRSTKDRMAALAAAGMAGAGAGVLSKEVYDRTVDADGYGDAPSSPSTQRKISSPVQSVSSLKNRFEESLVPSDSRPQSAASRSSAGKLREKTTTTRSGTSSPTSKLARSRQQSQNISGDEYATPLEKPDASFAREGTPGTPVGETADDWYERQHELNEHYRNSLDEDDMENRRSFAATNRDSYQTNPYPQDEKRFTQFTDDSIGVDSQDGMSAEQDVRALGANPQLMHHSFGAESNVASLMEPSFVGSDVRSSQASGGSPTKGSFAARLREMGKDSPSGLYNGSTMSQTMPSQDRWAALSSRAKEMSVSSQGDARSPRQSPAKSLRESESVEQPVMGASGLPLADDPIPEIGHFDDTKSEISTNPSIIQGPLGGDATGKDTWPYTPEPEQREHANKLSRSVKSDDGKNSGLKAAGASLGAAALVAGGAYAATHREGSKQPMVEDEEDAERALTPDVGRNHEYIDREATPTSPAAFRDEGYVTENTRSAGGLTPRAEHQYSRKDMDEYNRAMDAQDLGDDDPFVGSNQQHARVVSGNSHGMASPLYDSSTGKGVENIQSKDIVALMDHLTVRDAQRNARDTEILVSLVRSAAEMRQSFDDMKKFIVDQDRMIMADVQRGNNQVKNAVMSGPRAMPSPSNRTPRQSEEDIQTKRKGVLKRALKGLTSSKSAKDLERVEDMLMQILDNVEDLKVQQGGMMSSGGDSRAIGGDSFGRSGSLDSYERLRAQPDESGYEPEGQAGTSSTPSQSGYLATTPRAEKQQFHSGYDGRRGSENRVSTVLEGDEEELEPHESRILANQFENNEGFATPTQERHRARGFSPSDTPYGAAEIQPEEITPRSADKSRTHKSNGSSVFNAVPKISRWSKTTSSSAAPDPATLDSPVATRGQRPDSQASSLREYDDDGYSLRSNGRQRSMQSLDQQQQAELERRSMRSQASRLTRTPSPLIPSEASAKQHDDYDIDDDDRAISPIQEDDDAYLAAEDDPAFDDPKYHSHPRNSLLLQHPQPRKGPTGRHQHHLESEARVYDHREDVSATESNVSQRSVSDDVAMFGSSGTAALGRHRIGVMGSSGEPMSPVSLSSPRGGGYGGGGKDEGSLIPQAAQKQGSGIPASGNNNQTHWIDDDDLSDEDDYDDDRSPSPSREAHRGQEPQYSASGFSRGGYYSSPFGSGHLLEPIEEVRYSLETDSGHSPEPPQVATAVDVGKRGGGLGGVRKITGPRPMNIGGSGTVKRKAVGSGSADEGAY